MKTEQQIIDRINDIHRNKKPIAMVFYQDFEYNLEAQFNADKIKLDKEKATHICTLAFEGTQSEIADKCFREMNCNEQLLNNPVYKKNFSKAGHTSMSIGDFVQFEDGTILVCAPTGWVQR